jgi:hypothetical protein
MSNFESIIVYPQLGKSWYDPGEHFSSELVDIFQNQNKPVVDKNWEYTQEETDYTDY